MCEAKTKETIIERMGDDFQKPGTRKKKGQTNKLIGRAFSGNGKKQKGAPPGR